MTQGGPNNASLFLVLYLYRNAFSYFDMGYASAIAWVLFAIIMLFTLLVFRSSSLWVYYEGEVKKD
jgi:multiple sugar transport system permease protein